MRLVIALGGNALLQRGEPLEAARLRKNSFQAACVIAEVAAKHNILLVHGNGPQVGLLALQADAYKKVHPYPFDILGAESQGMIGYILQQAIHNHLPKHEIVTLLTQVIVNAEDTAFANPSKPIGPVYNPTQAEKIKRQHPHWMLKPDGEYFRRVVPSPKPQLIHELQIIKTLLENNTIVIAGGGGGIPCIKNTEQRLTGVEAVVDKDLTASLLARELEADKFIILTDVDAIYHDWNTENARKIEKITVNDLKAYQFAAGSMQPKVTAACEFVTLTKRPAFIGRLSDLSDILEEKCGTMVVDRK